jgi:hypothetical protein
VLLLGRAFRGEKGPEKSAPIDELLARHAERMEREQSRRAEA